MCVCARTRVCVCVCVEVNKEKNLTMGRKIEIPSEEFNMKEGRRYKALVLKNYHQDLKTILSSFL